MIEPQLLAYNPEAHDFVPESDCPRAPTLSLFLDMTGASFNRLLHAHTATLPISWRSQSYPSMVAQQCRLPIQRGSSGTRIRCAPAKMLYTRLPTRAPFCAGNALQSLDTLDSKRCHRLFAHDEAPCHFKTSTLGYPTSNNYSRSRSKQTTLCCVRAHALCLVQHTTPKHFCCD